MDFIGNMINGFFNLLVMPFGTGRHTVELVALSLLSGVVIAFAFKYTSNANAIKRAKNRLRGRILEMRIYQDDPALIFRGFLGTMRANVVYLGTIVRPFLVILIPLAIVFMQMEQRYSRANLEQGASTILSVKLKEGIDPFKTPVELKLGDGVREATRPVRVADEREVDWRLEVAAPGTHEVTLASQGSEYRFDLVAEKAYRMVGYDRASGFMEGLVHPALPSFGDTPFERVSVRYPGAHYPFLFWHVHWLVIFIIYSMISALVLKWVIKFEI